MNEVGARPASRVPRILAAIPLVAGLVLMGSYGFDLACSGMLDVTSSGQVHMKCFYTARAAVLIGFVMTVFAAESFFRRTMCTWSFLALGIVCVLVPSESLFGIGVCSGDMPCRTLALVLQCCGAASLLAGFVGLFVKGDRDLS